MPGAFRIVFSLLVLLLLDWYFFQSLKTFLKSSQPQTRKLIFNTYWGLTIYGITLFTISIFYPFDKWPAFLRVYGFGLIMVPVICKLLGCVFLLIEDMARLTILVWRKLSRAGHSNMDATGEPISRSRFISSVALAAAAIPFGTLLYGMISTAFDFKVRRQRIVLPKLPPGFEGLRVVHISDIHSGSFVSNAPILKAAEIIAELKPDIIFFTGDLVNNKAEEAIQYLEDFRKIKAPMGVYSTLGNHDYGDYIRWESEEEKANNFDALIKAHSDAGWNLLRNQHVFLEKNGDKIALIGVENWGLSARFPKYGDVEAASKGTEACAVKILLSHDPSHWDSVVRKKAPDMDLTLSGHTHGMQFGIEIPGFKWSPSKYLYKQWGGHYQEGAQQLYVNRGLGFLGYPGRVGIYPEITLLELSTKA